MKNRRTFWRGMGLGALIAVLLGCATPQTSSIVAPGSTKQMPNTQADIDACLNMGGTPNRDPEPPRPDSDPGPTFICRW